ncbi:hypothetical protein VT84_04445 [Gemmata sp. SH-PL17]|uniref:hypothetical protein n=1 Tax=Gemmata sp. SH-PL17 TaxID=1630693 RepID=UPI0004B91F7D|nr:hypothetical protein [Gemmata sp. SH-PL17]AMV23637.1 hypothetical protein VT84_04445 [Gemmata sp. SH-PL17]
MAERLTAKEQVQSMLDRGWVWRDDYSDVLVHPQDYSLSATYDRATGTLTFSPELLKALDQIIPTPPNRNPRYWRDEQKSNSPKK